MRIILVMSSLTLADLVLAAVAAIIGGIIAQRATKRVETIPLGMLVGVLAGVLIAQTLVRGASSGGSTESSPLTAEESRPSPTAPSPTPASTPIPASSSTASTAPNPITPRVQTSPPTPVQQDRLAWTVSALSSDAGDGDPRGAEPKLRFWHYEGTYGDVEKLGDYAVAPETVGTDCGNPYVFYLVAGVPAGEYTIRSFVPDVPNLSTSVEYGVNQSTIIVNQAERRGEWVELGTISSTEDLPGYFSLMARVQQTWNQEKTGCELNGRTVAFGPVEFISLSQ